MYVSDSDASLDKAVEAMGGTIKIKLTHPLRTTSITFSAFSATITPSLNHSRGRDGAEGSKEYGEENESTANRSLISLYFSDGIIVRQSYPNVLGRRVNEVDG